MLLRLLRLLLWRRRRRLLGVWLQLLLAFHVPAILHLIVLRAR